MTLKVRFMSKRPDTSAAFWWNSAEADIVGYCNKIKEMAQNLGMQHSYVESADALESVSEFTVDSVLHWNQLSNRMLEQIPEMLPRRLEYFNSNNHSLVMEWVDEVDNIVVFRNKNILILGSGAIL